MGFKSKSIETIQSYNCNPFKVGGLIFDSEEDYLIFKNIDKNITQIVKSVKDDIIDLNEVFNNIKTRYRWKDLPLLTFLLSNLKSKGPKSKIQIEIYRIRAGVLASKLAHSVS